MRCNEKSLHVDVLSFDVHSRNLFAEKVFAGGVPRCIDEKCNGVVKPGEFILSGISLF